MIHDLEPVLQRSGHDCGPAVARSVLRFYRKDALRIDATLRPCPKNGTPPDRLAYLFAAHGLRVEMLTGLTLKELQTASTNGPVLCPIQTAGDGHWVAVRGVVRRVVYLMDPAAGLREVKADEFLAGWKDKTADGLTLDRFGMAVLPR